MKRTRAERRYKTALIKKNIWSRAWNRIARRGLFWDKTLKAFVDENDEKYVQSCKRRALRNEGKWRHAGTKKFSGCSPNCWYCNPQARCEWRERTINSIIDKLDNIDFVESLYVE